MCAWTPLCWFQRELAGHGAQAGGGHLGQGIFVHDSLMLALGLPPWSPTVHGHWPLAFQQAARAVLLVLSQRGLARPGRSHQGRAAARLRLPAEICSSIIYYMAWPVSCWVAP